MIAHETISASGVAAVLLGALAVAGTLAGCNQVATQVDIDQAFNAICAYVPALEPVSAKFNGQLQNDYLQAQVICNSGSPTNAASLGVDILAVYLALEPYFSSVKVTPATQTAHQQFNAELRARGLTK